MCSEKKSYWMTMWICGIIDYSYILCNSSLLFYISINIYSASNTQCWIQASFNFFFQERLCLTSLAKKRKSWVYDWFTMDRFLSFTSISCTYVSKVKVLPFIKISLTSLKCRVLKSKKESSLFLFFYWCLAPICRSVKLYISRR